MIKGRIVRKSRPVPPSGFVEATRAALFAGALVIQNEVKRELRGGYRSTLGNKGDFVTGNSLNHVTIAPPVVRVAFKSYVRIGTDLLYNLYWELGHPNIFTRNFERDVKWAPAFKRAIPRARAAFARVYKRVLRESQRDTA